MDFLSVYSKIHLLTTPTAANVSCQNTKFGVYCGKKEVISMDCKNCSGSCGSCGGCGAALELTAGEIVFLEELAMFAFLPVARRADDMTPYYVEGTAYSREEYSAILLHLERKKLIDIDYGSPVGSYTDPGYAGLKVRGSVALTGRGQAVVEQLSIHGIQK
jgi:hypothetical protein